MDIRHPRQTWYGTASSKILFNVLIAICVCHNIIVSFPQMYKQFNVDGPKDFDQVVLDCLQQSSST
jgi:hypothetical protein